MERHKASKILRDLLDEQGLHDWKIRLSPDARNYFLGLCIYKDKIICLNALHIDTHPEKEVINTIKHEVAHALTPFHGHDDIWEAKARELGCDNTLPCATFGLDSRAIDAIRSGATLEVSFTEQVIRTPSYKITRLQDKCPVCHKIAKTVKREEFKTSGGYKSITTLQCGHIVMADCDSTSPFEDLIIDDDKTCKKHVWGNGKYYSFCNNCNARRLYKFQVEGARALERANGRMAILDEQGLGKAIQTLAYLKFHEKDAWPFLWVTKSGIKYQHAREIIRVLGDNAFPQVLKKGTDRIIPGFKSYLIGYDLFRRLDLSIFENAGIKTIILDECQAIKNPDSSRTQAIRRVINHISKVIPLSGTPWKNHGSEFYVMFNLLDPMRFHSYEGFKNTWVETVTDRYTGKTKEGGIRNPEKFRDYVQDLIIRRERIEVLPDLPPVNRTKFLVEMDEHIQKVYDKKEGELAQIVNDAAIDGTEDTFDTQSSIMTSLIEMRQIIGLAKVPATVELAKEFLEETDRKLVIFVHHIACGQLIKEQLSEYNDSLPNDEKFTLLHLSADVKPEDRFLLQKNFNETKRVVLIASTLASGEGLNLQTCCDCIMHERQWNPANEEQAEGRFARIGQESDSINATYVHADKTCDVDLDHIIDFKRKNFHNSMNKGSLQSWVEVDIIRELASRIAAKRNRKVA